MQDLTSQICVSNQNGCRTHYADLYKAISDASLNFISSVYRDTACHEYSKQEMNFAIEIVDTAVSERTAEGCCSDAGVDRVRESKEHTSRSGSNPPTKMDRVRRARLEEHCGIARREFQLKSGPREAV